MHNERYMNPYAAGVLLGLVLLLTIFITGRGLGASGALKSVVLSSVKTIAPSHYETGSYYQSFAPETPDSPLRSWLVFEIIGVIIGAFFSGLISRRTGLVLDKGRGTSTGMRIATALIGGACFGFGSQLGRGCTSGSALSGMAVMSLGGIITMMAIFGSAYALAFFFRKLWVR